ncbi:MAG: UPF0182 family protein [Desulfovibrionales bacterium]|nr:MAG: UPF0182 family protein [Desulfovibrionales bacterium]
MLFSFGPGPQGPYDPRDPFPQFKVEEMDFSKFHRFLRLGLLGLAVIVLWSGLNWAQGFYTDWLWFGSLDYQSVLWKIVTTRVGLYIAAVLVFLALAVPNLVAAIRITGRMFPRGGHKLPPQMYDSARSVLIWLAAGVVALAAFLLASGPAAEWKTVLRYLHQVPFGEIDPIFNNDYAFYIFTLPALEFFRSWLVGLTVLVAIIVGAFYYLNSILRGEAFALHGPILGHLAALGAFLFLLIAAGHWLSRYDLLFSSMGAVHGVGYTDNFFNLPSRAFMAVVALIAAGALVFAAMSQRKQLALWSVGGWFGLNLVLGSLVPGVIQRLVVEPSELARETPYLAHNISHTRQAFGLEGLRSMSHPALGEVDHATVDANQGTIQNIRLWDEGPLMQSYNQIQFFRLYYDFLAVHTDRYTVNDELRQVMLATRELSAEKLPTEAQRWVNRHLQFTHGYGMAMSPVTEVQAGGRPEFFIRDLPPTGEIPLDRPEVYYGLKSLDYLIVNSRMQEFNFPGPDGPVYTHYQGDGGVQLNSFFRRLMYAWQFKDVNILISAEITPESRIQYRRTIPERFATVTPFLLRDREAYSVVADGRLYWIQDAYTTTNRYPYATPWDRHFNYIRNSVKAVVDAYHGTLTYYVFDESDPLIRTYQAMFPDLFKSQDEMPEYLRGHVRYPLDLFTVQTQMLLQYHMQDPVVFYNKEDQWAVPVQHSFGRTEHLRPYYIVARLPGEEKEEFLLIQPFTPINRHNLVGWMAARSDGEHYGDKILFRFPTGRHVDGPSQVKARIDNDAVISEQFTLWGQVGSEVLRGILLVIPIGDFILYAEPVFLIPETIDFPELRRIILADSRQVVMHQTLDASVAALVGDLPAVAPVVEDVDAEVTDRPLIQLPDFNQGLRDAVEKLQDVVDQLRRLMQ